MKLLLVPVYLLGYLLSWCIPRRKNDWVFASGAGFAEGSLALADKLRLRDEQASITWLASSQEEVEEATAAGFESVLKSSWDGWWRTMTSRYLVVTHGLGDVNRFAVFRAFVIQLWHGAPIKKLHLDSAVTTQGPSAGVLRQLLRRMYRLGAGQVTLYVAGSSVSAQRLRSAFRVAPGMVRVLGDPRLDGLSDVLSGSNRTPRHSLTRELLQLDESHQHTLVLFAPTWRDGNEDQGIPTREEAEQLQSWARTNNVIVCVRAHPLGLGDYERLCDGEWVRMLSSHDVTDITPYLHEFSALITDYSSIAVDFSLTGKPIVWFAPDLEEYAATRGLYEPYEITTEGIWASTWAELEQRLGAVLSSNGGARKAALLRTKRLRERFHDFPEGGAAERVLDHITVIEHPNTVVDANSGVFFESFYGSRAACNPLALDREIANSFPAVQRYWSVAHERVQVPEGAVPLLQGSAEWSYARKHLRLLIVNDWLRYSFRRRKYQFVVQTWHGTPLKKLAFDRRGTGLRTRLAIHRERRRWSVLLTQNPHATQTLARSYAMRGKTLETGYPRNDVLAQATTLSGRVEPARASARRRLGLPMDTLIVLYAPTWRDNQRATVNNLQVEELAQRLGPEWMILARGHSRDASFMGYQGAGVIDVTAVPDINELILAADICITDYSSVMFDVSVARLPMMFFIPDLRHYRDEERGFTFDVLRQAPGPLLTSIEDVIAHLEVYGRNGLESGWCVEYRDAYERWRSSFNPHDDGHASYRVVRWLEAQGKLPASRT